MVYRGEAFKAMEAHIKHLEASTAAIYKNTKIEQLIADADGTKVKSVITRNHQTGEVIQFEVDDLIINYGYDRELKFIKESPLQIKLEQDFFVSGSAKSETNISGLYAAGDILSFDGKLRLIAGAYNDAANAVNQAKLYLNPDADKEIYISSHNSKFDEKNRELLSYLYQNETEEMMK